MKKVKITMTMLVEDEFYFSDLLKMKKEILSGEYQRDFLKQSKKGIINIKTSFEDV